jgi:D-alanyl-lipoteichoic acid acyltransferase DltB (MBOAT superfamily)
LAWLWTYTKLSCIDLFLMNAFWHGLMSSFILWAQSDG